MSEEDPKHTVVMKTLKLVELYLTGEGKTVSPEEKAQVIQNIYNSNVFNQARNSIINIGSQQFVNLPIELNKSLQNFSDEINKLIQKHNIPPEQVAKIREDIIELGKEAEGIEKVEEQEYLKKTKIKAKLAAVAHRLLSNLPKAAETIAAFTPLAPWSKLIGEGVDKIVKAIQKEEKQN